MRFMAGILAIGALCMLTTASAAAPVATDKGEVEGVSENGVTAYKGIPFAAPPVDDQRWKMPAPAKPWNGIYKADSFKPECAQAGPMASTTVPMSEDCLYLNIWTPATAADAKLPVMVWIHGGGFTGSSPSVPYFWGDRLAKHGVIVVNIAYRLGLFGFFAHPDLTAESPDHSSGNYALGDMIAGLQWVKRNIAAFGGDPGKVTVFGESAGSIAIGFLEVSPLSKGLYVGAIGESGAAVSPRPPTLADAEKSGLSLAKSLSANSLAELRALPTDRILAAETTPDLDTRGLTAPIIDGTVIPDDPLKIEREGRENDVPIIIGNNAHEGRYFSRYAPAGKDSFVQSVRAQFGDLAGKALKLYPAGTDDQAKDSQSELLGDTMFGYTMWTWANVQSRTGRAKLYYYFFEHRPPANPTSSIGLLGATHFAEVPYLFDTPKGGGNWTVADTQLSSQMASYWTNFAKTGDPNGAGLPEWPAYTEDNGKVMHFGDKVSVGGIAYLKRFKLLDKKLAR